MIEEINKKIEVCKNKIEESRILDKRENGEFYRGKLLGLRESRILADSVYKDDKLIKVTYIFFYRVTGTSQVKEKCFENLIDYTLWVRDITIRNPEVMITDVTYISKEEQSNGV